MADEDEDDTPRKKSSKGPKKRFGERNDSDDEDDRPRKKKRPADDEDGEEDDKPRSKRKADEDADADEDEKPRKKRKADAEDEDADDDKPRKKRRAGGGSKPVQGNERIPLVMLLAFIGSAVALLGICAGCGFLSYTWVFPDKDGGGGGGGGGWGGGGGNEFEVVSASRTQRPFETSITWTVKTKQTPASTGYYYVVSQGTGNNRGETQIMGMGKGDDRSGSHRLTGTSGPVDIWVEYRTTPVGTGKKVSNTFTLR